MSIQQYLVSRWRGRTVDQAGTWDVTVSFRRDGTFVQRQSLVTGQFQIALRGRYDVQMDGGLGRVQFFLQDWQPRQFCPTPYSCRPINLPQTQSVPFRPLGRDRFETQYGRFDRAGNPE